MTAKRNDFNDSSIYDEQIMVGYLSEVFLNYKSKKRITNPNETQRIDTAKAYKAISDYMDWLAVQCKEMPEISRIKLTLNYYLTIIDFKR
ncbi:MAG: hypothetical protein ACE5IW_10660 [bacterium]